MSAKVAVLVEEAHAGDLPWAEGTDRLSLPDPLDPPTGDPGDQANDSTSARRSSFPEASLGS